MSPLHYDKEDEVNGKQLRELLEDWTSDNCGWERRDYLGMSQVWRCPAVLYDMMTGELEPPDRKQRRMMREGLVHQADVMQRLEGLGLVEGCPELVAGWDGRYRGHPNGLLLIEEREYPLDVRSVSEPRFGEVLEDNRALSQDYEQMQAYLTHGPWDEGVVVYKDRAWGELHPVWVWAHEGTQRTLERKAREVLAAVDRVERPDCRCGRHRREGRG